jgi:hypothetical protein
MEFGIALGFTVGIAFLSINAIVLNLRRKKW